MSAEAVIMHDPAGLWAFILKGYATTVLIETAVLLVALSAAHPLRRKVAAGAWLTACTYPVVVLVLPLAMAGAERWRYLLVAETFAPLAECALFAAAFHARGMPAAGRVRDLAAIVAANLASFGLGEALNRAGW